MANNVSSGDTNLSTSTAAAITLLSVPTTTPIDYAVLFNNGTVDAQYNTDGGSVWFVLPAASSVAIEFERVYIGTITVRRVGGSNATGLWAYGFYQRP